MRHLTEIVADISRRNDMSLVSYDPGGLVFCYRYVSLRGKRLLKVAASTSDGWDHVSVGSSAGLPTWRQIDAVQTFLMRPDEWMMQLHVPLVDQAGAEETTLHLWRPQRTEIPLPPARLICA